MTCQLWVLCTWVLMVFSPLTGAMFNEWSFRPDQQFQDLTCTKSAKHNETLVITNTCNIFSYLNVDQLIHHQNICEIHCDLSLYSVSFDVLPHNVSNNRIINFIILFGNYLVVDLPVQMNKSDWITYETFITLNAILATSEDTIPIKMHINDDVVSFTKYTTCFDDELSDAEVCTDEYEYRDKLAMEVRNLRLEYVPPSERFDFTQLAAQQHLAESVPNLPEEDSCSLLGSADAVVLHGMTLQPPHNSANSPLKPQTRIFCGIFTTQASHADKVRAVADTWGRRCSSFLAFSTADDPSLPAIRLPHLGDESYGNMWQKTRSIWRYVQRHYRSDFDFFLLGGDDMYFEMDALRAYLDSQQVQTERDRGRGVYLGRVLSIPLDGFRFNSGGAGYVLDRVALDVLAFNLDEPHCHPGLYSSHEDVLVGKCLANSVDQILPMDTRDAEGRHRFHPLSPGFHFSHQIDSPVDDSSHWLDRYDVTAQSGRACCSPESVSFHYVSPDLMRRMDAFLHRCPQQTRDAYYAVRGEDYFEAV